MSDLEDVKKTSQMKYLSCVYGRSICRENKSLEQNLHGKCFGLGSSQDEWGKVHSRAAPVIMNSLLEVSKTSGRYFFDDGLDLSQLFL